MRSFSSQWIPIMLTSCFTSSYTTLLSASIPLQLSLGSSSIAVFPFLNMYFKFFPRLEALPFISDSSWGPFKEFLHQAFLWPLLTYASHGWFPFLSVTNITKLERPHLHRAASRAISAASLFAYPTFSLRFYLPYSSLEPGFLHCGVHSFLPILPL